MAKLAYNSRHPLPPFSPRPKIIAGGFWGDAGEWDDDRNKFTGVPEGEPFLATQTGAGLETQDGKKLIL
jgi:hypothetical protein